MLSPDMLSAFAPIGRLLKDNAWAACGACVLFNMPKVTWLVTARHVVKMIDPSALAVPVNRKSGEGPVVVQLGNILTHYGLAWVEDEAEDLAAAPWPTGSDLDIRAITPTTCLRMAELVPSMQSFTVGCPYGLHGLNPQKATPLVLDGVISGVDTTCRKVYTSTPTFPGNSGGPLIVHRSPFTPGGDMHLGPDSPTLFFAGIMLEMRLLPAADPGSRIPPLHLGVAAPADAVLTLLNSEPARAITARVEQMQHG
jgi:hypothetical protein